mgnify:CR=1 FL=1|jgi:hypothetical protein
MYDVDDERYLNPDNKLYSNLLSENGYLEDRVQELETDYEELEGEYKELEDDYEELKLEYQEVYEKYILLKKKEIDIHKMIQLKFENEKLLQENNDLKKNTIH